MKQWYEIGVNWDTGETEYAETEYEGYEGEENIEENRKGTEENPNLVNLPDLIIQADTGRPDLLWIYVYKEAS